MKTGVLYEDRSVCMKTGVLYEDRSVVWRQECCMKTEMLYEDRGGGIPLIGLIPPHACACPKPGHLYPIWYVVVFFALSEFG